MYVTSINPNSSAAAGTSPGAADSRALEFLAFTLGQEAYGIDIQKVQELRGYDTVTGIANAPGHIKGVVGRVSDVITLKPEQVKSAPAMGSVTDADDLMGWARSMRPVEKTADFA